MVSFDTFTSSLISQQQCSNESTSCPGSICRCSTRGCVPSTRSHDASRAFASNGADCRSRTQEFVSEFFDQNPISQMAILVSRDGQAERLSPLGGERESLNLRRSCELTRLFEEQVTPWNISMHSRTKRSSYHEVIQVCRMSSRWLNRACRECLRDLPSRLRRTADGCFARRHLPPHGSREVIIIMGSLTTCDPGNIHTTIADVEKDR